MLSQSSLQASGNIVINNDSNKNTCRILFKIILIGNTIILGLTLALFFVIHTHQPENSYFAKIEGQNAIPMFALNQPNLSTPALMAWVTQSTTEVFTFNFNDYRSRLQESSRNFTQRGWTSFIRNLQRSQMIEKVKSNQQIVTAAPRGIPVLESEGSYLGRYQWIVHVPMVITYQSGVKRDSQNKRVTLRITRVPHFESPNGVGIEQWIAN